MALAEWDIPCLNITEIVDIDPEGAIQTNDLDETNCMIQPAHSGLLACAAR